MIGVYVTWILLHVLAMTVHGDECTAALQETQRLSEEKVCCSPGNLKSNIQPVRCPANPIVNGSECCVSPEAPDYEWLCSYDEVRCSQEWKESEEANKVAQRSMIILFSIVGFCCFFCVAVSIYQDRDDDTLESCAEDDERDGINKKNSQVFKVAPAQESI
mmetsp:Transcript_15778/g.19239  ORF Transcript_15778/g.19239 Transcript_15778/m.19239 type:complete len:161 (-) Transcript_15778:350-832(-)